MIYIAGDKHGFAAIKAVEDYLKSRGVDYLNLGVKTKDEDLPLEAMIPRVIKKVLENDDNLGILSCGTGVGVEVGANKFSGIRACLATDEKIAKWSRIYDNCNILCLVGWDCKKENIFKILDSWFSAEYDGDKKRLKMFKKFNNWH